MQRSTLKEKNPLKSKHFLPVAANERTWQLWVRDVRGRPTMTSASDIRSPAPPPPILSATRPKRSHTLGLSPAHRYYGVSFSHPFSPSPLADVILGWPLINAIFCLDSYFLFKNTAQWSRFHKIVSHYGKFGASWQRSPLLSYLTHKSQPKRNISFTPTWKKANSRGE